MAQQTNSTTFTWELENFSDCTEMEFSDEFDLNQTDFVYLGLEPKNKLDMFENQILISLYRVSPRAGNVLCNIAMINDKEKECYSKEFKVTYGTENDRPLNGGLYNLDRDLLSESKLLTEDVLTIKCSVKELKMEPEEDRDIMTADLAQKRILANYQQQLNNKSNKYSDVVFLVGNKKKQFNLHKVIFASQSPVFAAMFNSDCEESLQNRVEITDVDAEVFEAMIRFIYTGNVDSIDRCESDLLIAADKYQLDSLKELCAQSIGSKIEIESVAKILLFADTYSAAKLKHKCVQYINTHKNASKVFATVGWKQLLNTKPELVFELYRNSVAKLECSH